LNALKKNSKEVIKKNTPIFPSNAALENCKCHGEMQRKKDAVKEIISRFFLSQELKISRVKKYTTITDNIPKTAAGNLTANSVNPNTKTAGTVR
jgi:hypothetical protein